MKYNHEVTMKAACDLYPSALEIDDFGDLCFSTVCNYSPIIESFGEILLRIDDDDWEGDSRVLYKFDKEIGILQFGWGSCSGCDALQACDSYEEIDSLIETLYNQIRRYPSASEAIKYFSVKRLNDGTIYDSSGKTKIFFRKSRQILRKMI